MKKIVFLLLIIIGGISIKTVRAQFTDVQTTQTNVILGAIESLQLENLTLQAIVESRITEMADNVASLSDASVISNLQSLSRIAKLMESFYCQTAETSILIGLSGSNCLLDMDIELALLNITYSQDIMKTTFLVGMMIAQSGGERVKKLRDVADALEKSINIFRNLNSGLRIRLDRMFVDAYARRQEEVSAAYMSGNRYTPKLNKK